MKKKHLAMLLAAALTVTSIDGTVLAVSGADFSSEPMEENLSPEFVEGKVETSEAESEEETLSDLTEEEIFGSEATNQETEAAPETETVTEDQDLIFEETWPEAEQPQEELPGIEEVEKEIPIEVFGDGQSGVEENFAAGAGEYIPVNEAIALELDQDYMAELDNYDPLKRYKWFSFTPAESGRYAFFSNDESGMDPYGKLHDSQGNYLKQGDNEAENQNFRITYEMTAGVTYYYKVGKRYGRKSEFPVRVIKSKEPVEITVNTDNCSGEFVAYFEPAYLYGAEVTVKYDENEAPQTYGFGNKELQDYYGNVFSYNFLKDGLGKNPGDPLEPGTYKAYFTCNRKSIKGAKPFIVQAKEPGSEEQFRRLNIGLNKGVQSMDQGCAWSVFIPSVSGKYEFSMSENLNGKIAAENKEGGIEYIYQWDKKAKFHYNLEAGKKYYIGFQGETAAKDETEPGKYLFDLTVTEKPCITGIHIETETPEATADVVCDFKTIYTVTYSDGSESESKIIPIKGEAVIDNKTGQVIYGSLLDSQNVEHSLGNPISEGTYKLYLQSEKVKSNEITITAKRIDQTSYFKGDLQEGKNKNLIYPKFGYAYYRFTASQSKLYRFDDNGTVEKLLIPKSKGGYEVHNINDPWAAKKGEIIYFQLGHGSTTSNMTGIVDIDSTEYNWVETIITQPTCTEPGLKRRECKEYNIIEEEEIPATGHSFGNNWVVNKPATCSVAGERHQECTVCKAWGQKEAIKPNGQHRLGAWRTTRAATALVTGIQERTCSVCGGAKQTRTIAKLKPTITLNVPQSKTLPVTLKKSFTVKVSGLAKGDSVKSWSSSNKKIVTVTSKGKLSARKTGTVKITVTLRSGKTAWFKVKVQKSAVKTSKITGISKKITLNKGKRYTLKPVLTPVTTLDKVKYSTSNKKVATVNSRGLIVAKGAGRATITVTAGRKKAKIVVTVPKVKTTKITGVKTSLTLKRGKSYRIRAKAYPKNSDEKITYSSSNKKIATVTSKGVIKAVKKGKVTITVKSGRKSVKVKLTVK
ncbi:MAG: Ig-like domain-containing protein [Blautia sp.]|uniref:Ig-like domain-containing protein n=1 Tax=Blautia sp. TaxID=1955243 RepID=UPI0039A0CCFF